MRCSIKVKEEFENDAGKEFSNIFLGHENFYFKVLIFTAQIYLKTTVFEHEILSETWKSELFLPTLSARWNQVESTLIIPLNNEDSLEHISIKVRLDIPVLDI